MSTNTTKTNNSTTSNSTMDTSMTNNTSSANYAPVLPPGPKAGPRGGCCIGGCLLSCLPFWGLPLLLVAGALIGVFPWVGVVIALVVAVGLLLTYRTWRRDPKLVVHLVMAGAMVFVIACSSLTAGSKLNSWWWNPAIPTSRGIVSRSEWFNNDYLVGYKDWKAIKPPESIFHIKIWFDFLFMVPVGGVLSFIEVFTALVLPNRLFHVDNSFAPFFSNDITLDDDPLGIWEEQVMASQFMFIHYDFSPKANFSFPCPQGNCIKEWSYFWGVEEYYKKWELGQEFSQ